MLLNAVGHAERKKYFSCAGGRVFRMADLRKQDHKFISALAADGVGVANASQQSFRNGLKKLVADRMSQRIVDVFEMIQIQKKHGKGSVSGDEPGKSTEKSGR